MDHQLSQETVALGRVHLFRGQQSHMLVAAVGAYLGPGLLGQVERVVAALVRTQEPKQRQELLILAVVAAAVVLKQHQMPVEVTEALALLLLKSHLPILQHSLVVCHQVLQHLVGLRFTR
jgi:hypothetical protein